MNLALEKNHNENMKEPDWPGLIEASLNGKRSALEDLLKQIQPYVYNVAIRMVLAPDDAEDVAQEVLIKLMTHLKSYDSNKSKFTTWVYAIVRNHVINMKTSKLEAVTESFEAYGMELENVADIDIDPDLFSDPETRLLIKEANVGCMMGMLLCLSREQRIIYILGEILRVDHKAGSEICKTTTENFRQKLSRARKDLYEFMNDKCGLINKNNPCRCHKKTKNFIKAGWVDPANIKFSNHHYENTRIFSEKKADAMCNINQEYGDMYRNIPVYNSSQNLLPIEKLLSQPEFNNVFKLEKP